MGTMICLAVGKPLRHVRDRLELMGYTVRAVEHHYARLHRMHGMTDKPIPFATLRRALAKVDVTHVSGNYSEDYDPGEFVRKEIIKRVALASERHQYYLSSPRPDHWEVDLLLENFGASGALRLSSRLAQRHAPVAGELLFVAGFPQQRSHFYFNRVTVAR